MENGERRLSSRELEQVEILGDRIESIRDEADEQYPEIVKGAAMMMDCYKQLKKEGFPDAYAINLVGVLMDYLRGN